ncbi:dethiobiotin synthase [Chitinophaga horti]|uniref:ATP-dependent dethiobiotin synthetase BioD n=1 Tax=Chitinophaga horti TaxID=2920382 RepID=A0ABY6J6Q4_9BACT|nr:dethiobiotin synthase [Chitinophaga horti]UYQ95277.1 dethiobiotin synthase [Chitinophaga horti]
MNLQKERIFITGIGTGVGKTIVSACVTEALNAGYWKPVQAGLDEGTDTQTVASLISRPGVCQPEAYRLQMPASPHLAARSEAMTISQAHLLSHEALSYDGPLVIEGAGGLMVPLNDTLFTIDFIKALHARVIIVAQNYLGSINHSLLTAMALQQANIPVVGWIFNGDTHTNEADIVRWSHLAHIGRVSQASVPDKAFVQEQAAQLRPGLIKHLQA